jgi:hypothetical protein
MRLLLKAIAEAGSADPTAIRDAIKNIQFTNVMGAPVKFDDHNQAGKLVLIEGITDRKLTTSKRCRCSDRPGSLAKQQTSHLSLRFAWSAFVRREK